jgi:hypothetical protein
MYIQQGINPDNAETGFIVMLISPPKSPKTHPGTFEIFKKIPGNTPAPRREEAKVGTYGVQKFLGICPARADAY